MLRPVLRALEDEHPSAFVRACRDTRATSRIPAWIRTRGVRTTTTANFPSRHAPSDGEPRRFGFKGVLLDRPDRERAALPAGHVDQRI